jgi:hypothetical protein
MTDKVVILEDTGQLKAAPLVTTVGSPGADANVPTEQAVAEALAAVIAKSLFDAYTILVATDDNTPIPLTVAEQTLVGRITSGVIAALTATQVRTLLNVADGANAYVHPNHSGDVTSTGDGATAIAANAVTLAKLATQAAETILANATASAAVPAALSVAEQTLIGRITGGVIAALTAAQVRTLLNVADGANNYVHPTTDGNIHLPATGASAQLVQYASAGTGKWITISGDITIADNGAITVGNTKITYAKMQNISATDKVLGRSSAGAGSPEEIPCTAAGRALLDDAAASDQRTTLGLGTMAVATATDYVAKVLFDAYTILMATTDNTPVALTVGEQTLVGRKTGGAIAALTAADVLLALGITSTIVELNYTDGVTSAIQTQLDAKLNSPVSGTPADHSANGPQSNTYLSGATVAQMQLVFMGSGGKWLLTDADAIATMGMLGIALEAKNDTQAMLVALSGCFVRDDSWSWTVGGILYASGTAGALTHTQPAGVDGVVRVVGYAVTSHIIWFEPESGYITHV